MSVFTVYKITNLLNSRYYLGVHETNNPNDDYLGSGIVIKRAVKKYGRHNFTKEVITQFSLASEAYAKEVELLQSACQDQLCYNLHEGGQGGFKYINDKGLSDPGRAGRIAKEKGNTGRRKGAKTRVHPISPDDRLLCEYGCFNPAKFLVGKKETPCCSHHQGSCSAYSKHKKSMKVKMIEKEAACGYGCGAQALFLLGNNEKPCCSKTFYECSAHWRNRRTFADPELKQKAETTMLAKYGVTNPILNLTLQAKKNATILERFGGLSPSCRPDIEKKRIKTNQLRYGGNSPASSPDVMAKMQETKRKHQLPIPLVKDI
jgi:hypothetical protein